jgi:hypothetical protein
MSVLHSGLVASTTCLEPYKSVAWRNFLANARLSGPRTHFSFLLGYVLIFRPPAFRVFSPDRQEWLSYSYAIILANLILPLIETRQSAFSFQA